MTMLDVPPPPLVPPPELVVDDLQAVRRTSKTQRIPTSRGGDGCEECTGDSYRRVPKPGARQSCGPKLYAAPVRRTRCQRPRAPLDVQGQAPPGSTSRRLGGQGGSASPNREKSSFFVRSRE